MITVKGGVTVPEGFFANGLKAGIKKSGKKDLALIYSQNPAVAAAAFTTNVFKSSHINVSAKHVRNRYHRAVIVNAGNANCANGKPGDRDALRMCKSVADELDFDEREVLAASTGIIGRKLPIEKIENNVPALVGGLSKRGGDDFAESILTTDTVKKEMAVKIRLGSKTISIGGACKGVGMIYPVMKTQRHATLLCFVTTDAAISKKMLEEAVSEGIEDSFNMVSVDGDMSTNDTCYVLANALAGNRPIKSKGSDYRKFTDALRFLLAELAKMVARDGEGATKFVEITVAGARCREDAVRIARKISTSSLLKCCIYGQDPNWGRVVAAAGSSGVDFNPDKVDLILGGVGVLRNGGLVKGYDPKKTKKLFEKKDIYIKMDLKSGRSEATAWTCDFSKEYVAINSEYST